MHFVFSQYFIDSLRPILADAAVKGIVLLILASVGTFCLSRASAAMRHLLWVLALTSIILVPVVSLSIPGWRLHWHVDKAFGTNTTLPPKPQLALQEMRLPLSSTPSLVDLSGSNIKRVSPQPASEVTAPHPAWHLADGLKYLPAIWLAGVIVMLLRVLLGSLSLWRLGRHAKPVDDPSWQNLLDNIRRQAGVTRRVSLVVSDKRSMPMTWGVIRPTILIPHASDSWSLQRRRLVLMHEIAHVQRYDCLAQWLSHISRAIHWFNPLSWWATRQMTIERELACDDLVLAGGTLPSDYAEQLLAVAATSIRNWNVPIAAVAMARPSKLGDRIMAILDPNRSRAAVGRKEARLFLALLAILVLPLSIVQPFAGAAQIAGSPANGSPAAMSAELPPLSAETRLVARVDLKSMTPEAIASTTKLLFGDKAGIFDAAGDWYTSFYSTVRGSGATTLWVLASLTPEEPGPVAIYVQAAQEADAKSLAEVLKKKLSDPHKEQSFTTHGKFVVIRERPSLRDNNAPGKPDGLQPKADPNGWPAPIVNDPAKEMAFAKAIAQVPANEGLQCVVVVDEALKSLIEKPTADLPYPMRTLLDTVHASESVALNVKVGEAPALSLRVQCIDDTQTKYVSVNIDQGLATLGKLLLPMRKKLVDDASPESTEQAKSVTALIDQIAQSKALVKDHTVELSFDSQALASVGRGMVPFLVNARQRAAQAMGISNMRQLLIGVVMYANDHEGQLPDKLEQITNIIGDEASFKRLMTNPVTNDPVGYIYQKPAKTLAEIKNPSQTIILFEAKAGQKNESGFVGYADGHVQRATK